MQKVEGLVGGSSSKIYDCLNGLGFSAHDKIRLTQQFDEETVSKSTKYCTRPEFVLSSTLDSAIFYFCKNPDHMKETQEMIQDKKLKEQDDLTLKASETRTLCGKFIKSHWEKIRKSGIFTTDFFDSLEITDNLGTKKVRINYSINDFMENLNKSLKSMGCNI